MNRKSFIRVFALVLLFSLLLGSSLAYADTGSKAPLEAKSGVVRILTITNSPYDGSTTISTGTGFCVGKTGEAPEYILTNAHVALGSYTVVEDGQEVEYNCLPDEIYILLNNEAAKNYYHPETGLLIDIELNEEHLISCEIVNDMSDLSLYPDVALLKAARPVEERVPLPLIKDSDTLMEGDTVYTMGFPGGADDLTLKETQNGIQQTKVADLSEISLTSGIISKKTLSETFGSTNLIVHNAPIDHGNSGGPLLNEKGQVVGLNTYGLMSNEQYGSIYINYGIDLLELHKVDYMTAQSMMMRQILLISIIVVVAVVAILLIIKVNKSVKPPEPPVDPNALRVQGVSGFFANRRFALEGQISFGRDPSNSLVFPSDTPGVSANHCVIINNNGQLFIKDLGSSYGTAVNGNKPLAPHQLVSINVGDKIYLGSESQAFIITRHGGRI